MTILHYIPSIDQSAGGVGTFMQLLARDFGQLCELHVVTHRSDKELVLENCQVHYIPYKWLPWNNCKTNFIRLLDEIKPDIVHANSCWMPVSALVAIWAKEVGCKVVYTPHGMLEPWIIKRNRWKKIPATWLFQRKGLQVCDVIHATSEMEKQNLLKLGWNKRVEVIPNCIQVDQLKMKKTWVRKKVILFLSRVHEKKGLPFLIDAVAELREELEGYTIKIVGPGESVYVEQLKKMARARGVGEMFKFLGPVFGDEKWPLYREADLFVLPSYSENFGIVIPEALASGTPVITTKGTPWEELETCGCGFWTEIGTKPLGEALKKYLTCTDEKIQEMGKNGRQLVEDKYSSCSVSKKFLDLYSRLIDKNL